MTLDQFAELLLCRDPSFPPFRHLQRRSENPNGSVMQRANTADMMWSVADAIVLISDCMSLEAGDVIIMGTPAGVGAARIPPVWMRAGDRIEISIEQIGTLTNTVRDE